MKTLHVIIEPGKDGFGVMFKTKGLEHLTSFGETLEEAKKNAREVLSEMKEFYTAEGLYVPEPLNRIDLETVSFKFSFLLNNYFRELFPFLNVSKLAESISINPSLLRQYDKGIAMASEEKYNELRRGLHTVGKRLEAAL